MKELLIVTGIVGGLLAMVLGWCAMLFYMGETSACNHLHRLTGVETDVSFGNGCMVKYKGEWVEREVMTNHKQEVEVK